MDDIIKISVNNIYQSREVIEKRNWAIKSFKRFDKFITAYNNKFNGVDSNYDKLILKLLPEKHHLEKKTYMSDYFIFVITSLYLLTGMH
jgi:dGTPase